MVLSAGVKRATLETDVSSPSSPTIKNAWNFPFTYPHAFMAWRLNILLLLVIWKNTKLRQMRCWEHHRTRLGPLSPMKGILALCFTERNLGNASYTLRWFHSGTAGRQRLWRKKAKPQVTVRAQACAFRINAWPSLRLSSLHECKNTVPVQQILMKFSLPYPS